MAVDIGTAQGYLDLDISRFTSALTQANAAASTQMQSMSQNFSSGFQAVGNTLTSAGKTMTTAVTAPVAALGTAAVKTTATFDSSMSKVQALSGATGDDLETLRSKAKEMGATTRYSASEAADALGYMALAGWDTNQMVSGLDGVLNLAAASDMDLATASDMVTDYLSAFGLEAKDAGKMADQMAYAQAHSNTSTIQLGDAFGNCAANMSSAGQTMETTTALLEAMANQGTKGSEAGTALAAIMRDITNKMEDGAIAIGDTSIAVQDENGNFRSLIDIMADVEKATDGMGTAEKSAALSSVFTAHSIRGVNQILMEGTDTVKGYEDALYGAGGTAKEMADQMLNNLNGQLTILKSALEGLAIQIGEILMPYVQQFVGWVQQLVEKFSALSTEEKEQIIKIALMAAAIGPVLLVLGKFLTSIATMIKTFSTLKTAFGAIKAGFTGLSAAIGGISAPIVAIVAVIGVLIAAFATLWNTNEQFRTKMTAIWDGIKAKFEGFANGVVERLNALGFDFENFTQVVSAIWNGFCELLAPVFEMVFSQISNILGAVLNVITGLLDIFIGLFTGNWEQLWTGVKEVFGAVWDFVLQTFQNWATAFSGVVNTILGWFGTSWQELWNSVVTFFTGIPAQLSAICTTIWTNITTWAGNMVSTALQMGQTFVSNVVNFFTQLPTKIAYYIGYALGSVIKWAVDMPAKAMEMGTNFINNVVTFFTQLPGKILQFITSALQNIQVWVTNVGAQAKNAGTTFLNNITTFFTQLPGKVQQYLTSTISNLARFVTNMAAKARAAASGFINAIVSGLSSLPSKMAEIGSNIVSGIWNGISAGWSWLTDKVSSLASSLLQGAKDALGISSPSKAFRDEFGYWLPLGAAVGVEKSMPKAVNQIQTAFTDGLSQVHGEVDANVDAGVTFNTFTSAFKQATEEVTTWFETVEERLANSINSMGQMLLGLVESGQFVIGNDGMLAYVGYNGMTTNNTDRDTMTTNGKPNDTSSRTYVFYSNKSIDEIEAAKQMKKTERDIAEGFM